ncbi:hypothetical protein CPB84DRAFT_1748617 [Gymnopilus junonius]|uniref:Uncharacterized protein n=1 Tax=Gymnopilus junonius TaxID=109634 RepID=A0A9P5NKI1_GYMJU|nr:hypothetical protein CPB84DRAFT_1748617 [Gymnopilus junonius]
MPSIQTNSLCVQKIKLKIPVFNMVISPREPEPNTTTKAWLEVHDVMSINPIFELLNGLDEAAMDRVKVFGAVTVVLNINGLLFVPLGVLIGNGARSFRRCGIDKRQRARISVIEDESLRLDNLLVSSGSRKEALNTYCPRQHKGYKVTLQMVMTVPQTIHEQQYIEGKA